VIGYNSAGRPVETRQTSGNSNAMIYGHQNQFPIAIATNATSQEIAYTSLESDDQNLWVLNSGNQTSTDAFSGNVSRKVVPGTQVYGPTIRITPTNQSGKFRFSCWVKSEESFSSGEGHVVIATMNQSSTALYPANSQTGSYKSTSFGDTNGEWKLIEVEIDLDEIRQNGNIPVYEVLRVGVNVANNDPNHFFLVDELKLYPTDALMQTITYDPIWGVSGQIGTNGQSASFEFDEYGRLIRSRNHQNELLQGVEYHYKNQ
jgi:hypothetical protein